MAVQWSETINIPGIFYKVTPTNESDHLEYTHQTYPRWTMNRRSCAASALVNEEVKHLYLEVNCIHDGVSAWLQQKVFQEPGYTFVDLFECRMGTSNLLTTWGMGIAFVPAHTCKRRESFTTYM